jgi:hypothetical protein
MPTAKEEKERTKKDCLAVKNLKQMIAGTISAAGTGSGAAAPAAAAAKVAEARKESARSAESADGWKPIQNHGEESTVEERGPAEEIRC